VSKFGLELGGEKGTTQVGRETMWGVVNNTILLDEGGEKGHARENVQKRETTVIINKEWINPRGGELKAKRKNSSAGRKMTT